MQHPVAVEHPGDAHPDRRGRVGARPGLAAQDGDHLGHRVGHLGGGAGGGPRRVPRALRGAHPRLADHVVGVVHGHAEHLGPADVDTEGDGGPASRAHAEDSTRAFRSRSAVAMIRLCARILMNPGIGTRNSTSRW